ncbi:MAG: FAD-dependent oxidoreductase [Alphaproteobacteria bacterium]|nr:FAD-dependent oxidoreductase [Alphaproteobacteria bacterium]
MIGAKRAKNRIMRVATTANLADGNKVGPRVLAFYKTLAKGGVGTIVTEALRVQAEDPFGPGALVIFDRSGIAGLKQISDACHAEGALLIGQLNMGGRQHLASRVAPFTIAPSAIACPRSGGVPHELTIREVRETIETYVMCAVHCMEAGMDGVEIHGAQGHLIQQFVSPFSNRRTDEYGGNRENRLRFPREILEQVRRRIGRRAIVGYRMGVEEFTDGGLTIDDTVEIARELCADGLIDYLSLSQGNFNSIETHLPDRHWPHLAYQDLHKRFIAVAGGIPVVASTRIQGPEQAETAIATGEADMVGMCRALLVDPDWPKKAERGEPERIRRCIACNQCWAWISTGEPIACATNPVAGREHLWPPLERDRAEMPASVMVVGGGPAGLEAARVAAVRGHDVTLFERNERLGGRLRDVHRIKFHDEMANLLDYLVPEAKRAGVTIHLGATVDVDLVLKRAPDHVVIATGADAYAPDVEGDGSVPVMTSDGPVQLEDAAGRAVIVVDADGYYWTEAMVESVIEQGARPIVITRVFEVGRELPAVSRIAFLREIDKAGGEVRANTYLSHVEGGGAVLKHYLTGRPERIDNVAAVVWVGAARANGALAEALREQGFPKDRLHVVGDAFAPRRLANALTEAHRVGRSIGSPKRQ